MPDNQNQLPKMIPLSEVAESLSVTPEFLYKEIDRGNIVAYFYARAFYFTEESVKEYLERAKEEATRARTNKSRRSKGTKEDDDTDDEVTE